MAVGLFKLLVEYVQAQCDLFVFVAYCRIRRDTRQERSKGPWFCAREADKISNKTIASVIIFPHLFGGNDYRFVQRSILQSCTLG